jgi:glucan endo-1,3-beta-D-glucosidase
VAPLGYLQLIDTKGADLALQQAGTTNSPISAIPAAIRTKTSLLLGIWCSAGQAAVDNELAALKSAIDMYGTSFAPLVAGISVGSEDLYRITPTGLANKENPGANPDVLAHYIKQVRDTIAGTVLAQVPIGHVDTWTAWVNGSNKAVIDAVDWVGVDAYAYFETAEDNIIQNNKALFQRAVDATKGNVGGKPIWITETGFPVSGKTSGKAVPSLENAQTYWRQVGCPLFGNVNTWWYTMRDAAPDMPNPSFGLIGSTLTTTPLFDLSCKGIDTGASVSGTQGGATPSSTSGSSSGNGGSNGSNPGGQGTAPTGVVVPGTSPTGSPGMGSGGSGNSAGGGRGSNQAGGSAPVNGSPATACGSYGAAFAALMVAMLAL